VRRRPGFAAISGLLEEQAGGAELSVGGEFVLDVGHAAVLAVAAKQFDRTEAIFAAEISVFVDQCDRDVFDLPVGLVASTGFDSAAADFALVHLLAFDCHCFPIVLFRRPSCGRALWWACRRQPARSA